MGVFDHRPAICIPLTANRKKLLSVEYHRNCYNHNMVFWSSELIHKFSRNNHNMNSELWYLDEILWPLVLPYAGSVGRRFIFYGWQCILFNERGIDGIYRPVNSLITITSKGRRDTARNMHPLAIAELEIALIREYCNRFPLELRSFYSIRPSKMSIHFICLICSNTLWFLFLYNVVFTGVLCNN